LLEHDPEVEKDITDASILYLRDIIAKELEEIHGEPIQTVIIQERYAIASNIVSQVLKKKLQLGCIFQSTSMTYSFILFLAL